MASTSPACAEGQRLTKRPQRQQSVTPEINLRPGHKVKYKPYIPSHSWRKIEGGLKEELWEAGPLKVATSIYRDRDSVARMGIPGWVATCTCPLFCKVRLAHSLTE